MKIQYDKQADAMYIYLKEKGKIEETVKVNENIFVDVDKKGNIIGIELLEISKQVPQKEINKISMEMPVFA